MSCAQATLARHARQAADPRPAQQAKQQGFSLVIAMLPEQQHLPGTADRRKRLLARIPRCTLDTCARLHLHGNHLQGHSKPLTQCLTMGWPRIGRRL